MYTSHGFDDPSNITCHHQSADIKSSWSAIDWTTRVRNLQHTEMNTTCTNTTAVLYMDLAIAIKAAFWFTPSTRVLQWRRVSAL